MVSVWPWVESLFNKTLTIGWLRGLTFFVQTLIHFGKSAPQICFINLAFKSTLSVQKYGNDGLQQFKYVFSKSLAFLLQFLIPYCSTTCEKDSALVYWSRILFTSRIDICFDGKIAWSYKFYLTHSWKSHSSIKFVDSFFSSNQEIC